MTQGNLFWLCHNIAKAAYSNGDEKMSATEY